MAVRRTRVVDPTQFTCERYLRNKLNASLVKGFSSEMGFGLAEYLKAYGLDEEIRNYRAYYLIKDGAKVVAYFSIQCGSLVLCDNKEIGGITHTLDDGVHYFIEDEYLDVTKTLPAVELSHFCMNDAYRKRVKNRTIDYPSRKVTFGTYIFYKFIAPKLLEISTHVGLQYVYLFCADDGTGKLWNYYTRELKFKPLKDKAVIRQYYDTELECLTMSVASLSKEIRKFEDLPKEYAVLHHLEDHGSATTSELKSEYNINDISFITNELVRCGLVITERVENLGIVLKLNQSEDFVQ